MALDLRILMFGFLIHGDEVCPAGDNARAAVARCTAVLLSDSLQRLIDHDACRSGLSGRSRPRLVVPDLSNDSFSAVSTPIFTSNFHSINFIVQHYKIYALLDYITFSA